MKQKKMPSKKGAKTPKKSTRKRTSGRAPDRNVFFRPDRMSYVRRIKNPQKCVFCRAATEKASFDTLCLYKSSKSMIILNKFPYNSGHLLVLPLAHIGDLTDLSEVDYVDLHQTLKIAIKAIQKIYMPAGLNIGMNQGAASGAGIPEHLHYHLIPRWAGDLNFFPLIAETKVVVETLEQTFAKLSEYFNTQEKTK